MNIEMRQKIKPQEASCRKVGRKWMAANFQIPQGMSQRGKGSDLDKGAIFDATCCGDGFSIGDTGGIITSIDQNFGGDHCVSSPCIKDQAGEVITSWADHLGIDQNDTRFKTDGKTRHDGERQQQDLGATHQNKQSLTDETGFCWLSCESSLGQDHGQEVDLSGERFLNHPRSQQRSKATVCETAFEWTRSFQVCSESSSSERQNNMWQRKVSTGGKYV